MEKRISRRVIAEHHLALTETYNSPWEVSGACSQSEVNNELVGRVFLRCNARQVLEHCGQMTQQLLRQTIRSEHHIPQIKLSGHLDATFPYIVSHLEYMVGELLRNSMQAVAERYKDSAEPPPPIEVLVCEAPQLVIFRISDQGGGVSHELMPHLWSFSKGPRRQSLLSNLLKVPKLAATMQELELVGLNPPSSPEQSPYHYQNSSLSSLTSRPPNLRLGMGLPMSRVYAEYWAGSLELHSLEGYGVDTFLQISKLGNKNEQLSTRASIDAV